MATREPRVVVVTGASAGVGRATAELFGARGDQVALLARGRDGLRAAAADVVEAGGQAMDIAVDMADADAVEQAAERIEDAFGPIDVWINNAFVTVFGSFLDTEPDEFRRVTDVTYHGYVNGTRAALRRMMSRDHGTVVQVGSALAYRGIPLQSAYCGAKHAIQGMTEALRCELLHEDSHVAITMVHLPAVNTPQFDWSLSRMGRKARPLPPIYQPEVAARAIVHAAEHPRRREHWVGTSTFGTLVANRVAPGLLDRYLARTGYEGQQSDEPESADRPANLWKPVDDGEGADAGARGRFDTQSRERAPYAWLSRRRGLVAATVAATAAGAGWLVRSRRGRGQTG